MLSISIKPADKLVKSYYDTLGGLGQLHFDHEGAVRRAFQDVLAGYGRKLHWTFVPEYPMKGRAGRIAIDGALLDEWKQRHGFWEAKDTHDQLDREIKKKIELGYPTSNTIFQMPERAVLFQRGVRQGVNEDITSAKNLVELLREFFAYREPEHEQWDEAVAEFSKRIPELADRAKEIIGGERKSNKDFREAFESFFSVCRKAINPNLSDAAVQEMLVQHLLTERIFRRVFHAEEFRSRNVIAAEIEKVITSMTSRHFSRDQFLSDLDRFYKAIERAADDKDDYTEKQAFLNTVYERFFQGYSPKEADTHGIVYTPQPIVDFMVRSVEDILKKEFGRSLADKNVHILDPFVGTGNFITRVMKQIAETDRGALPYKYEHELHCNEVMLLPYYIASMNIEHEYLAQTGEYKPFDGICLVDTFDIKRQTTAFSEENTRRISAQNESEIFVAIANPPYNAWQITENDNNKNTKYAKLDELLVESYVKTSSATNKSALWDMYVRAFRWASDRIGDEGIIAFITNNGFAKALAFDGMRKSLAATFTAIYHVDLKGNARTSGEQRRREGGNVFEDMIRVGVGITILVKKQIAQKPPATIYVYRVPDYLGYRSKYGELETFHSLSGVPWQTFQPERGADWFAVGAEEFTTFAPIAGGHGLFQTYSNGTKTNRDAWMYNFNSLALAENAKQIIGFYNREVDRWKREANDSTNVDDFVEYDLHSISWSRDLKQDLADGRYAEFANKKIICASYRPFTRTHLFFDRIMDEEIYSLPRFECDEQLFLCLTGPGSEKPFMVAATREFADIHFVGAASTTQCFPFYVRPSEDGAHRRENITDWALEQFRSHYHDPSITKWDIFHYVYAVLHHPEYRARYAANLKRELPRIPFLGSVAHAPSRVQSEGRQNPARNVSAGTTAVSDSESRSEGTTGATTAPYQRLSDEAKDQVLSEVKRLQDEGLMQYASQDNLRVFRAFATAGRRLAEIHVHYEQQPQHKLETLWSPNAPLDYRVTKMRLSKDKSILTYNDALTLKGIPKEAYDYRLGNRSALEWVIDQYQVSTDKRSGITNDPNRADDPQYILRLIGQVITVSLETVRIVNGLPEFVIAEPVAQAQSAT